MNDKANILLVDDHLANLIALEAMLKSLDQNLVRASSGEEALLRLLEQDFAVILMDVQMANMDGFETAHIIKQRERNQYTPIIFITAIYHEEHYISQGYLSGAVDYLQKPIVPEVLRAKVSVFVDLYHKTEAFKQQALELERVNQAFAQKLTEVHVLNRQLEALNTELESFSYSVSHDLRAPLRSMKGFSQALLQGYETVLDEKGQDFLYRIVNSCDHMSELIEDLLQLSRVTRGQINMQWINLSDIVQNVVRELRVTNPDHDVNVSIEDKLTVQADPRLMKIVFTNLLNNAWKFTRETPAAQVEFGRSWQDNRPIFYVRDNGAGFDMSFGHQLFQPFQRLHTEGEFEGNGIGLATTQRIIHRHGGEIWADGAVGRGASFYFTLGDHE